MIPDKLTVGMVFKLLDGSTIVITEMWGRGRNRGLTFKEARSGDERTSPVRRFYSWAHKENLHVVDGCRKCGCTDGNCEGCVQRTGQPCHWVEDDLCSACAGGARKGNEGR